MVWCVKGKKKLKYQSTSHFLPPLYNGCWRNPYPVGRIFWGTSKRDESVSIQKQQHHNHHLQLHRILFRLSKSIKQILLSLFLGSENLVQKFYFWTQSFWDESPNVQRVKQNHISQVHQKNDEWLISSQSINVRWSTITSPRSLIPRSQCPWWLSPHPPCLLLAVTFKLARPYIISWTTCD